MTNFNRFISVVSYLGLSEAVLVRALPVPHGDGVVGRLVQRREQRAVRPREGEPRHAALQLPAAQHRQRGQRHRVPHADMRLYTKTFKP